MNVAPCPAAQHLHTIHPRYQHVEHDQVGVHDEPQPVQGLSTVGGLGHLEPFGGQVAADDVTDRRLVVDDQDPRRPWSGHPSRTSARATEPAERFGGAGELEAPAQHRVVGGLAAVAGDGPPLAIAVHGDREVDLDGAAAPEVGAELGVERGGDGFADRPGEDAEIEVVGGGERGAGGLLVVGVAGHPAVVEDHQQVAALAPRGGDDVAARSATGISARRPSG